MRTIIHEMRNQLAVAVANIEAFIDGKLEPTPRRLQAVLQALTELDALLDDVRPQETVPMPTVPHIVDICTIVGNEVVAMEAAAGEKNIEFDVRRCPETHAGCRAFSGDPIRVGQAVKNLLLNAVRYTPSGGTVSVTCEREADTLCVTIVDDGPGLSGGDLDHVFERGYRGTASREIPGSGMGLAVAKQIVEEHGGSLSAGNAAGRGATFRARLHDPSGDAGCDHCARVVPPAGTGS